MATNSQHIGDEADKDHKIYGCIVKEKSKLFFNKHFQKRVKLSIDTDDSCLFIAEFTKFRISSHWLPIERGRYKKPKIPRDQTYCCFCETHVGTEFRITPGIQDCPSAAPFKYIMLGNDVNIIKAVIEWVAMCNTLNKNEHKTTTGYA